MYETMKPNPRRNVEPISTESNDDEYKNHSTQQTLAIAENEKGSDILQGQI